MCFKHYIRQKKGEGDVKNENSTPFDQTQSNFVLVHNLIERARIFNLDPENSNPFDQNFVWIVVGGGGG